jgi:sulfur carrier protein ThiS
MAKLKSDAFTKQITVIDAEPVEVLEKATIKQALDSAGIKNATSVNLPNGDLIPASRFNIQAPEGFTTNISPIEKG